MARTDANDVRLKNLLRPRDVFYNLFVFSEGTRRLSLGSFKAYTGWLFVIFAFAIIIFNLPINYLDSMLHKGQDPVLQTLRDVFSFIWSSVLVWLFVVYIFAVVYRLHDMSLAGWWLLLIVLLALSVNFLPIETKQVVSLFVAFAVYTLVAILGFLIPGTKAPNKYGKKPERSWRNFPFLLMFLGYFALFLMVAFLLTSVYISFIMGTWR